MKWFQKRLVNLVVTGVVCGILTSALYADPPSDRCILIKVATSGSNDVQELADMGLDIWEFQEDGVIIRVTDDERKQIIQIGFFRSLPLRNTILMMKLSTSYSHSKIQE